ncbi:hypothetical protein JCM9279_007136 [Rhodotorula babjevae]
MSDVDEYSPERLAELVAEGWPTGDNWADWVGTAEKIERDALGNPNIAADSYRGEINRVELRAFVKDLLDVWCQRVFPQMAQWERHAAIDSLRSYHDILVNWDGDSTLRYQLTHARPFLGSHVHDENLDELVRRGETNARRAHRHEVRGLGPAPSSAARASATGRGAVPVSHPRPRAADVAYPAYVQRRQRRARLGRYKGVQVDREGWPSGRTWADYVRTAEIVVNDGLENDHIGGNDANNDAFRAWIKEAVEPGYDRRTLFDRLPEPVQRECIHELRKLDEGFISYTGGFLHAPSQRDFVDAKARSVGLDPVANANANRNLSAYEPRARTPTAQHPPSRQRSRSGTRTPVPHHSQHDDTPAPHRSPSHAHNSRQPTLSPDPLDLGDYNPSWHHDPAAPYDRNLDDPEFDLDDLLDGWAFEH